MNVISNEDFTIQANSIIVSSLGFLRVIESEFEEKIKLEKAQHDPSLHSEMYKDNIEDSVEFRYDNVFKFKNIKLPYIPLLGSWGKGENEFGKGDVNVALVEQNYITPEDFRLNPKVPKTNKPHIQTLEPKCRLESFEVIITPKPLSNILTFTFSEITYKDYLLTGQYIDDEIPNSNGVTYRDKYASNREIWKTDNCLTSNICGVGIFIVTSDNKIILTQQSDRVIVSPNLFSYSASGTMDWSVDLNPFDEVARECYEEIGHAIDVDNTYLIAFGLESKKLYYQFTFIEYSRLKAEEILEKAQFARDYNVEVRKIFSVSTDLTSIMERI